jgi:hypothetical protein
MTSAKLQRSLGLVLAIFAIGFLAILAFPPDWQSKPTVTAEIGQSLKGETPTQ